jgi:hypothetical protein
MNEGSRERQKNEIRGRNKFSRLFVPWFPNYRTFQTALRYAVHYCVRRSATVAVAFKDTWNSWRAAFGKKGNF